MFLPPFPPPFPFSLSLSPFPSTVWAPLERNLIANGALEGGVLVRMSESMLETALGSHAPGARDEAVASTRQAICHGLFLETNDNTLEGALLVLLHRLVVVSKVCPVDEDLRKRGIARQAANKLFPVLCIHRNILEEDLDAKLVEQALDVVTPLSNLPDGFHRCRVDHDSSLLFFLHKEINEEGKKQQKGMSLSGLYEEKKTHNTYLVEL